MLQISVEDNVVLKEDKLVGTEEDFILSADFQVININDADQRKTLAMQGRKSQQEILL